MCQTIPFTSDADEERNLLRELKFNMAAADCPFIVQFFGAFFVDVRSSFRNCYFIQEYLVQLVASVSTRREL